MFYQEKNHTKLKYFVYRNKFIDIKVSIDYYKKNLAVTLEVINFKRLCVLNVKLPVFQHI